MRRGNPIARNKSCGFHWVDRVARDLHLDLEDARKTLFGLYLKLRRARDMTANEFELLRQITKRVAPGRDIPRGTLRGLSDRLFDDGRILPVEIAAIEMFADE